ncbi:MAG: radical SAM protein [Desulfatibacillaceae bacterium]
MRYEGPIYRPPSEADSLLVQATIGCPHNRCTFCMVYKDGPRYRVRPVEEIREDLREAHDHYGDTVRGLFFPAGNTIAMRTDDLCEICRYARELFPGLSRITVYGSSRYIVKKGEQGLRELREAGLSRIHVGLESGDDVVLRRVRKGTSSEEQIDAGGMVMDAGITLSLYVVLGLGGRGRTREHAIETARVLNVINPDFIRLRTFVPKVNTPMLDQVRSGAFEMLGAHGVLEETRLLVENLDVDSMLTSDHYTNYLDLEGRLPGARERIMREIDGGLARPVDSFRPFFVGNQ